MVIVRPGSARAPSAARRASRCFAEEARARAAAADVVVVNTHLYGAHLASGGAVLPDARRGRLRRGPRGRGGHDRQPRGRDRPRAVPGPGRLGPARGRRRAAGRGRAVDGVAEVADRLRRAPTAGRPGSRRPGSSPGRRDARTGGRAGADAGPRRRSRSARAGRRAAGGRRRAAAPGPPRRRPTPGSAEVLALAPAAVGRRVDALRRAERDAGDDEPATTGPGGTGSCWPPATWPTTWPAWPPLTDDEVAWVDGGRRAAGAAGLAHRRRARCWPSPVGRGDRRAHLGHRAPRAARAAGPAGRRHRPARRGQPLRLPRPRPALRGPAPARPPPARGRAGHPRGARAAHRGGRRADPGPVHQLAGHARPPPTPCADRLPFRRAGPGPTCPSRRCSRPSPPTSRPACSPPSASGRASTSRAARSPWSPSTGSPSPGPTTRCSQARRDRAGAGAFRAGRPAPGRHPAGPGGGPAHPLGRGPRGGGRPRPPAGHRRLPGRPAGRGAAHAPHHRPRQVEAFLRRITRPRTDPGAARSVAEPVQRVGALLPVLLDPDEQLEVRPGRQLGPHGRAHRLEDRPPLPMTIPFWESRSTRISQRIRGHSHSVTRQAMEWGSSSLDPGEQLLADQLGHPERLGHVGDHVVGVVGAGPRAAGRRRPRPGRRPPRRWWPTPGSTRPGSAARPASLVEASTAAATAQAARGPGARRPGRPCSPPPAGPGRPTASSSPRPASSGRRAAARAIDRTRWADWRRAPSGRPGPIAAGGVDHGHDHVDVVERRGGRSFSRSPSAVRGRCRPGVSTKTTWASGRCRTPRTWDRVVLGRGEVIETLVPTMGLTSVDLPTLGRPTTVAKPERKARHAVRPRRAPGRRALDPDPADAAALDPLGHQAAPRRPRPTPPPRGTRPARSNTRPPTVSQAPSGSSASSSSLTSSTGMRAVTRQLAVGQALDGRLLHVVLVDDLAHQLLDQVLQGDQAGRAAVLVDHHRPGGTCGPASRAAGRTPAWSRARSGPGADGTAPARRPCPARTAGSGPWCRRCRPRRRRCARAPAPG